MDPQPWEVKVSETPRRFADKIAQQQLRQQEIDDMLQQMTGLEIKNAFNPRRFSDKIALQKQRQTDMEEVMVSEMNTLGVPPQSQSVISHQDHDDRERYPPQSPAYSVHSRQSHLTQPVPSYESLGSERHSPYMDPLSPQSHISQSGTPYHHEYPPNIASPQHPEYKLEYPHYSSGGVQREYPRNQIYMKQTPYQGSQRANGFQPAPLTGHPTGQVMAADRIRDEIEGRAGNLENTPSGHGNSGNAGGSQSARSKFTIDFLLRPDNGNSGGGAQTNQPPPAALVTYDDVSGYASATVSGSATPAAEPFHRERGGSLRVRPRPKVIEDPFVQRRGQSMRVRKNTQGAGGKVKVHPNIDYGPQGHVIPYPHVDYQHLPSTY
eukprot:comp7587_c0_seq1/m.3234 comp7587_c0_seq1/g.3234  ORF comp7587_c0_seq1/g.3234 comp7587_c0_seq1/m.3234 type:complete len:379 (-) comp7587_c0_seq1:933-2069(-)